MSVLRDVIILILISEIKNKNVKPRIGEIECDIEEKSWYAIQSTEFNENKVIIFLKLLVDLRGALIKYLKNQTWNGSYTNYLIKAKETIK